MTSVPCWKASLCIARCVVDYPIGAEKDTMALDSISKDQQLQRLLDRVAIEDCLVRYCHAVDRCDPDLLRTVYWPEATDDHVFWVGGAEDFVNYCMPFLRSRDQTMHS